MTGSGARRTLGDIGRLGDGGPMNDRELGAGRAPSTSLTESLLNACMMDDRKVKSGAQLSGSIRTGGYLESQGKMGGSASLRCPFACMHSSSSIIIHMCM